MSETMELLIQSDSLRSEIAQCMRDMEHYREEMQLPKLAAHFCSKLLKLNQHLQIVEARMS